MKRSILAFFLVCLAFVPLAQAQNKRKVVTSAKKPVNSGKSLVENIRTAVVIDERLAVLRMQPSLYARPIQRMRRGRLLSVTGSRNADGIIFYRVSVPPNNYGWVQAEAVAGKGNRNDEGRLAQLIQASDGFEKIERATLFLENFPNSTLRPSILLLLGDLAEENALKLSTEATRRLVRREMAASNAPLHSFYLNYAGLDRFRRIGIDFLFNSSTKNFHYNGANWKEIVNKFPQSTEFGEAQKRLESLTQKMEKTSTP